MYKKVFILSFMSGFGTLDSVFFKFLSLFLFFFFKMLTYSLYFSTPFFSVYNILKMLIVSMLSLFVLIVSYVLSIHFGCWTSITGTEVTFIHAEKIYIYWMYPFYLPFLDVWSAILLSNTNLFKVTIDNTIHWYLIVLLTISYTLVTYE